VLGFDKVNEIPCLGLIKSMKHGAWVW